MRAGRAAVVIEGQAVVLERRVGARRMPPRAVPDESFAPINDNRPARPAPRRGESRPDLVFPDVGGQVRSKSDADAKDAGSASRRFATAAFALVARAAAAGSAMFRSTLAFASATTAGVSVRLRSGTAKATAEPE